MAASTGSLPPYAWICAWEGDPLCEADGAKGLGLDCALVICEDNEAGIELGKRRAVHPM